MLGKNAHIVVCGFPKAGVSLLYHMLVWVLPDEYKRHPHQTAAFRVLETSGKKVTFAPMDLFWIKELAVRSSDINFIVCVRDPRDVLTSTDEHGRYHISWDKSNIKGVPGLRNFYAAAIAKQVLELPNVYRTSFEDIVQHTQSMQERLSIFLGLRFYGLFEEFFHKDRKHLKPLDFSFIRRWETRTDRVNSQMKQHPEIKEALHVLGYNGGRSWVDWR